MLHASTVLRKIKRHYLQYQSVCAVSIASRNISNRIKEMDRYIWEYEGVCDPETPLQHGNVSLTMNFNSTLPPLSPARFRR